MSSNEDPNEEPPSPPHSSCFAKVPPEILLEICGHLDAPSLARFSQTCKYMDFRLCYERKKAAKQYALPSPDEYEREHHDWDEACRPREHMAKAVRDGRYLAVQGFLEAEVDPNSYTSETRSLLGLAICKEQVDIVQLLLRYGADPSCLNSIPLAAASLTLDLLLRFGAKTNLMREFTAMVGAQLPTSMLDLAILNGSDLPSLSLHHSTVLHISIDHHYDDYSYFLLRKFPELLDKTDNTGSTALTHALLHSNEPLALELLRHNAGVGNVDAWGVSDMWLAVNKGYIPVIREMLARWHGSQDTLGMDPLQSAITMKQFEIVALLLEHAAFQTREQIRLAVACLSAYPEEEAQGLARALKIRFPGFCLWTRAVI
ncbi:ankyrin repeat-containing domain protein [Aspergillus floccosus]